MTIIEHFDAIDSLVLNNPFAKTAEVRGHIAAIREQIESYSQKAEELGNLEARYAELQAAHEKLLAGQRPFTAESVPMKRSRDFRGLV